MTSTGWAAALVVVLLIVAGGWFFLSGGLPAAAPAPEPTGQATTTETGAPQATTETGSNVPGGNGGTAQTITMAEVALHASASSCWSVIRGGVYDLTTWIPQHPGGPQAIAQLCGKDGTALFTGQHGGSAEQENRLATFKIGVLAQ